MSEETAAITNNYFFISRVARVLERSGLAMAGATCGIFVSAYLSRGGIDPFGSIEFIASMIVAGAIGFYLGIDIPMLRASHFRPGPSEWNIVELLGATGTFLAAVAALA